MSFVRFYLISKENKQVMGYGCTFPHGAVAISKRDKSNPNNFYTETFPMRSSFDSVYPNEEVFVRYESENTAFDLPMPIHALGKGSIKGNSITADFREPIDFLRFYSAMQGLSNTLDLPENDLTFFLYGKFIISKSNFSKKELEDKTLRDCLDGKYSHNSIIETKVNEENGMDIMLAAVSTRFLIIRKPSDHLQNLMTHFLSDKDSIEVVNSGAFTATACWRTV